MIRTGDVVLTGLMIAVAIWTFQVKNETKSSAKKVSELRNSIRQENDKIELLEADWAVLNHPSRLQKMAERFEDQLQLQPLQVDQITTPDDLPPIRIPDDPIGALAQDGAALDGIITGSTREQPK